ncbi:lipopolysaccharide biosynthesis protein [Glutamicibacter sp. NPDC087344]|uniref:lipopolysaccharide biosynthesis protein n=1 Tax=Glutamicibacter sp. NPDC087344 TaxID=3363994 RepID=UPI003815E8F5
MTDPSTAMDHETKRQSTATTTVLTFLGVFSGALLAFGITIYLGHQVGEDGTGQFFQIVAFFSIAITLATFGADTGLVRNLAAQKAVGATKYLGSTLTVAGVPAVVLALLLGIALWMSAESLETRLGVAGLAGTIRVMAPLLVPATIMNLAFGALRGLGRVATFSALQNILLPALRFSAVVVAVAVGGTMIQLAAAWSFPTALAALLACVVTWQTLRRIRHGKDEFTADSDGLPSAKVSFRGFWGFSSARGASALVETMLEWIDVIAVAVFLGPAAAGIYGAVNRCVRLGVMLEHTARLVTGPMLSACLAVGNRQGAKQLFGDTAKLLVFCAWPFYLTLAIFAPAVLSLFGPGFAAGALPLAIISLVMMLVVSAGGVQSLLLMAGKSRWQLGNKTCALLAALVLNLWLVPAWGLLGAVTAWSVAVLVDCLLATIQVSRAMGFGAPLRQMLPLAATSLLLFGVAGIVWRVVFGPSLLALGLQLATAVPLYLFLSLKFRRRLGLEKVVDGIRASRIIAKLHPAEN